MLAILGGTGPEGKGLALRLALAGEDVIIGSRSTERGAAAAAELAGDAPGASISGSDNAGAAAAGDVVFLAFPYEGQRPRAGGAGWLPGQQDSGQRHRPHGFRAGQGSARR